MGMPTPFEMGRLIGGNVSGGIAEGLERRQDRSVMDEIMQKAANASPEEAQNMMNQIIRNVSPQNRDAAIQMMQNAYKQKQSNLERQSAAQYYQSQGLNPNIANLPEGIQKEIVKGQKQQKEDHSLNSALDIINRQKSLLKKGNLGPKLAILGTGRKAGSTFTKEGIKDRAEYERLGKALISKATTIPIRNRLEFETLADKLYDPLAKQEEIEGSLLAMERIIRNSMGMAVEGGEPSKPEESQYVVGQTATNPQTGEKLIFNGFKWEAKK